MSWTREDLQDAFDGARRRPGFAAAVLLSLGIGIGAVAAVFSLVDAVLLRPLPYHEADRVVGVWFSSPNFPGGLSRVRQSFVTFTHIRDRSEAFESFALAEKTAVTVDEQTDPVRLTAAVVTAGIFPVLQIAPALGRPFTDADNAPGAEPAVMLTAPYWASRFGRDPGVIGRTLSVDGVERRIIGVLPEAVRFPEVETQIWVPLVIDPATMLRSDFVYTGYGRLRPGIDLEAADADFGRLVNLLPEVYPAVFPRQLVQRLQLSSLFVPLREELVGGVRQTLVLALLAVLVVLMIVVANVANLFIVRNEARHRDLAIQAAIGAGPGRLVRAIVTEGVAYALVGGAIGLLFGAGALALLKQLGPGVIPRVHEVGLGARAVGVVLLLAIVTGAIVGLVPAIRLRSLDLNSALRAGGKTIGEKRAGLRLRWALVAGQVALALTLLVNAGLLVRSVAALHAVDTGFDATNVLGARMYLPARDYPTFADVRQFYQDVVDRARALPGVEAAAAVTYLPQRDGRIFFAYQFENTPAEGLPTPRLTKSVTEGYFETLGIPLIRGRTFARADVEAVTDAVIVNEAFAASHWPGQDAIGKRLRRGGSPGEGEGEWFTVVGVVKSERDRELAEPGPPIVYFPLQERTATTTRWREMSIALRANGPLGLVQPLREIVASRDRRVPIYDVRTMEQVLADATARSRYTMLLLIAAAAAALVLAAVGLYGVLAYVVNERRREMGLRIALGATPREVRGIVVRQALALAGVGVAAGLLVTFATNRVLASLLYGVQVADPATLAAVTAVLGAVTWMAARVPAGRAAGVHPAITLREE